MVLVLVESWSGKKDLLLENNYIAHVTNKIMYMLIT